MTSSDNTPPASTEAPGFPDYGPPRWWFVQIACFTIPEDNLLMEAQATLHGSTFEVLRHILTHRIEGTRVCVVLHEIPSPPL